MLHISSLRWGGCSPNLMGRIVEEGWVSLDPCCTLCVEDGFNEGWIKRFLFGLSDCGDMIEDSNVGSVGCCSLLRLEARVSL